jgi:hypothetical protein
VRGVPAKRYAFLISPRVQVPDVRVEASTWDRIARGVPRDYVLPDETFLAEIAQLVRARQKAVESAEKAEEELE